MYKWPPEVDPFYEEFSQYYVCANWNGIRPDGSGRQHVTFLGKRRAAIGEYALCTPWPDCSELFHTEEAAAEFLRSQDELRPHPLGAGWEVVRIADFKEKYGYEPISALITIGNDNLEHPGPRKATGPAAPAP
ncbi:hypothetical protein GOB57_09655 [Sinorhizobium meliloti]|nr:hypothetical protein [Sinorhizobium meliloti]